MSECDCQKNIKKPIDDGSTRKLIGDGLIITIVAATTAVMFFGLSLLGMR